ncbi:MAG: hypothetical protein CMG60_01255 [Candidatus Marinimicrobia bacterium]|nr:hypothetical protein [Candidatus Neomarinimicrobiota bacterium]|tara:strand:+ start:1406 stop:1915 length:510 start_codon:yes stop_codon:yes gene_type:complete
MKILAGKFGGRLIKTSQKLKYRPTKSIIRKSIFDSLNNFCFNSVLDLFSGTGILGFEAASRGAQSVTFVENNLEAFRLLKINANHLSGPEYSFHKKDAFLFLKKSKKYDLVFADPPYLKYDLTKITETILEQLNKKGKFYLECEKNQSSFMDGVVRDYGRTRILYWENI